MLALLIILKYSCKNLLIMTFINNCVMNETPEYDLWEVENVENSILVLLWPI